jgi:hypothetical protein
VVRVKNRRVSVKMVALIRKAFWGCYTYLVSLVIGCDLGIPTPHPSPPPRKGYQTLLPVYSRGGGGGSHGVVSTTLVTQLLLSSEIMYLSNYV